MSRPASDLIARIAWHYYVQKQNQAEIAANLTTAWIPHAEGMPEGTNVASVITSIYQQGNQLGIESLRNTFKLSFRELLSTWKI